MAGWVISTPLIPGPRMPTVCQLFSSFVTGANMARRGEEELRDPGRVWEALALRCQICSRCSHSRTGPKHFQSFSHPATLMGHISLISTCHYGINDDKLNQDDVSHNMVFLLLPCRWTKNEEKYRPWILFLAQVYRRCYFSDISIQW